MRMNNTNRQNGSSFWHKMGHALLQMKTYVAFFPLAHIILLQMVLRTVVRLMRLNLHGMILVFSTSSLLIKGPFWFLDRTVENCTTNNFRFWESMSKHQKALERFQIESRITTDLFAQRRNSNLTISSFLTSANRASSQILGGCRSTIKAFQHLVWFQTSKVWGGEMDSAFKYMLRVSVYLPIPLSYDSARRFYTILCRFLSGYIHYLHKGTTLRPWNYGRSRTIQNWKYRFIFWWVQCS